MRNVKSAVWVSGILFDKPCFVPFITELMITLFLIDNGVSFHTFALSTLVGGFQNVAVLMWTGFLFNYFFGVL